MANLTDSQIPVSLSPCLYLLKIENLWKYPLELNIDDFVSSTIFNFQFYPVKFPLLRNPFGDLTGASIFNQTGFSLTVIDTFGGHHGL